VEHGRTGRVDSVPPLFYGRNMSLRSFIESILPYRVMQPVMTRRAAEQKLNWESDQRAARMALRGSSWEDVSARASGYDNAQIDRLRAARWARRPKGSSLAYPSVLSLLIAALNLPRTAITDFGGGTGDLGEELARRFSGLRYTVVETASLVELMAHQDSSVTFTTELPHQCDIFHISGTLHYLTDPLAVLERGMRSAREFAVVRRTRFSDVEMFDVQVSRLFDNGLGPIPEGFKDCELRGPRRTLVERDVLHVAKGCGFVPIYRTSEPIDIDGVCVADIVFRRDAALLQ
jgi:hypothetical protein